MKILHIISSVNPANGGPIEGVKQLGRILVEMGHQVEVCSLDAPDAPWVADCPLPVFPLGPSYLGYSYTPKLVAWLRSHSVNYDCVLVNGIWQFNSFASRRALKGGKTPYFVFTHGMLDPWFKDTYPLKHLKKRLYWRFGEYPVLRDARAVLFTCEEEKQLARKSFRPYDSQEAVITYGTSAPPGDPATQRETFLTRYPALRDKRLLLYLSRLHEKKGCDLLLEAFARVAQKDAALHLVMAGPDQTGWVATLQQQAARLGIERRVSWPGMLSGDLKWGAYHAADVFVLPSHQENFGIVVAEAMACAKPVLISNKINIWREIEADGAGLIARDDLAGTISLLEQWLAMPNAQQEAMRRNALCCFTERFEIHRAAQSLLDTLYAHGVCRA